MRKFSIKPQIRARLLIAMYCLGIQYLTLILSLVLVKGSFSFQGLMELIRERLTEPGDAVRYLDLAENGYVREGENAINLVFYPLYPLMIRLVSFLTGGNMKLVGLMISQLSYAAASAVLWEWIRLDHGAQSALFGALLLALHPFSVFVMGIYSESLFLLLSISCLYFLRRQRFAAAGIAGFLAALCRTQGMLLILPAIYEWIILRAGKEQRHFKKSDACLLLIPAGFGVYLLINVLLHGDPFRFLQFEAGEPWYQTTQWIGRNIALQYDLSLQYSGLAWIIYIPQIVLYFFSLGVLFLGIARKHRTCEVLYGAAYLGFTYLSGWMISGGRYMMACVPLYAILAGSRSDTAKKLLIFCAALLHVVYSLLFYAGYAIM